MREEFTLYGFTQYKLKNGFIFLLHRDISITKITINVTYNVGSRHEGLGETGMAHLLEHMLFKGSKKFPDIKNSLSKSGAVFNASTWYDRTNYYETLVSSEDNLNFALNLESDRMVNSFIRQKDLDDEMKVVRNEFEMVEIII